MKNIKYIIAPSLLFLPTFVLAFSLTGSTFSIIIDEIISIISLVIPIFVILALIFFFWGLSKFILNSGSKDGVEKGKTYMFWGILALFILLTFRAIVGFIARDLNIGDSTNIPTLKTNTLTPNVTTDESFRLNDGTNLIPQI